MPDIVLQVAAAAVAAAIILGAYFGLRAGVPKAERAVEGRPLLKVLAVVGVLLLCAGFFALMGGGELVRMMGR